MSWPEPVERVAAFLRDAGAEARIEEFASGTPPARTRRTRSAAQLGQIVKSLVFVCDARPGARARFPATGGPTREKVARAAGAGDARVARRRRRSRRPRASRPAASRPFPPPTGGASWSSGRSSRRRRRLGRRGLRHAHGDALRRRARAARRAGRLGGHRAGHPVTFGDPRARRHAMQETEKIWMNGELVDWADARVHVGVHGLHYGSGRLRGHPLLRDPKRARPSSGSPTTCSGCTTPRGCSTWSCRTRSRSCARRRIELVRGERAARLLHPADRLLRLRGARRRTRGNPVETS